MAIFPNPILNKARLKRFSPLLFLSAASLAHSLSGEPFIPFAEDLFPELREIMEHASTEATELRLGSFRLEEREGDLEVVQAQRRPQARMGARVLGSYEMREDIDDDFRGVVNANLSVTQPLYRWGNLERQESIARHRVELEALEMERTGASQFMQLRQAYLQWLLMQERQDILRQSIELSESFVAARRQLVEAGQSSEQDVLEMEARLLENRENLAWVEKYILDVENSLSRFSGPAFRVKDLKGHSLEVIQPMSEAGFSDLKALVQGKTGHFNDPQRARWEILETIEDQQLAIIEKQTWPTLDLVAGIFSDQLDAINQQDYVFRTQYFVGFQMNWHIFDGWQKAGLKRSTLARKRSYALRKQEIAGESGRRAESLLSDLQLNLKQIEARGLRQNLLERRVTLLREQAQRNLVTGVELIEGEIAYLDVNQRLMEARVNYLINLMQLGVLLDMDPAARYYSSPQ